MKELKELSNKELLDLYKISVEFIRTLETTKEEANDDRQDQ